MDGDDDMIMIIVGDYENETIAMPSPQAPDLTIKEEPVEDNNGSELDPGSILAAAKLHGQYIHLKKEDYYNCEYLEVQEQLTPEQDYKIKLEDSEAASSQSDSDVDDDDIPNPDSKPRQPYIDQLCKNFPKMRKDEEYLVSHLAEVMKQIKPPIPPIGFCMNVNNKIACSFCDKVSDTLPIASRHYQKRHGIEYLVCYACGLNYRCTTALYKHEMRCQAPSATLVLRARGRYLGRKGRRRPFLTLNKFDPWRETTKDKQTKKRYYCSQCTDHFSHMEALISHEYMHAGIRPFKCDQCSLAYTSGVALRRHQIRHLDLQYICDVCGRSFKAKNSLIVHMNTHLPQRKFPCDRCERRFAQKTALQHHINRDHLKIPPPLACTACPKRFPRVSNLNAHMKAKHGLSIMTKKMFFKALPSMKETQLKQATMVFNKLDNDVVAASLGGESVFIKKDDPIRVDDEDPDSQVDDPGPSECSVKKVITEIVPTANEDEPYSIIDSEMVQETTIHHDEEILGTVYETSEGNQNEQYSYIDSEMVQETTIHQDEEILGTVIETSEGNQTEPYSFINSEIVQEIIIHQDEVILSNVNETSRRGVKKVTAPKKAAIKTSLPESCELEFVKFISKRGGIVNQEKTNISAQKKPRIDSSVTRMHNDIKAVTGGRSMPLLTDPKNNQEITNEIASKVNIVAAKTRANISHENSKDARSFKINARKLKATNKIASTKQLDGRKESATNKTNNKSEVNTDSKYPIGVNKEKTIVLMNESAYDLNVNRKKVSEGPAKSKTNLHKKTPMRTRSGVMKTRSGAIIKSER